MVLTYLHPIVHDTYRLRILASALSPKDDYLDLLYICYRVCKETAMGNDEHINSPEFSNFIEG